MNSLQLGDDVALALAFQNALHEDMIPSLGTHMLSYIYINV